MNKEKYMKFYNLARETIENKELLPEISEKDMEEIITDSNSFRIIPGMKIEVIGNLGSNDKPNIYFNFKENGSKIQIGLTFDNQKTTKKFKDDVLNSSVKEKIMDDLKNLDDCWKLRIEARKYRGAQQEDVDKRLEETSNQIDKEVVQEISEVSNKINEKVAQGKYHNHRIKPIVCKFELDEDKFQKRFKEAFDVLVKLWDDLPGKN